MLKIVNLKNEWHVIYWFRADLLKEKDLDLNFTTYSSQLPQICPLFDFDELSFHGFICYPISLGFICYPISLGFICCPIPPAYQYPASLGNWAKFCLPCICPLSHFPNSLGWLIVLLLAQVHQLSIFLQAVGSTNSYPFFQVSRKI